MSLPSWLDGGDEHEPLNREVPPAAAPPDAILQRSEPSPTFPSAESSDRNQRAEEARLQREIEHLDKQINAATESHQRVSQRAFKEIESMDRILTTKRAAVDKEWGTFQQRREELRTHTAHRVEDILGLKRAADTFQNEYRTVALSAAEEEIELVHREIRRLQSQQRSTQVMRELLETEDLATNGLEDLVQRVAAAIVAKVEAVGDRIAKKISFAVRGEVSTVLAARYDLSQREEAAARAQRHELLEQHEAVRLDNFLSWRDNQRATREQLRADLFTTCNVAREEKMAAIERQRESSLRDRRRSVLDDCESIRTAFMRMLATRKESYSRVLVEDRALFDAQLKAVLERQRIAKVQSKKSFEEALPAFQQLLTDEAALHSSNCSGFTSAFPQELSRIESEVGKRIRDLDDRIADTLRCFQGGTVSMELQERHAVVNDLSTKLRIDSDKMREARSQFSLVLEAMHERVRSAVDAIRSAHCSVRKEYTHCELARLSWEKQHSARLAEEMPTFIDFHTEEVCAAVHLMEDVATAFRSVCRGLSATRRALDAWDDNHHSPNIAIGKTLESVMTTCAQLMDSVAMVEAAQRADALCEIETERVSNE